MVYLIIEWLYTNICAYFSNFYTNICAYFSNFYYNYEKEICSYKYYQK